MQIDPNSQHASTMASTTVRQRRKVWPTQVTWAA